MARRINAAGGEELRRQGREGEGKAERPSPILDPHRPYRPLYITVDGGRMEVPTIAMGASGPMQGLIYAKKAPNPQIGSGGAMWAEIGGLLELLLQ
jgi:hypothetical protein